MATVLFSDTTFTSTCEMVYHFVTQMHWQAFLKLPAMECIYAGMVTDTASFRFPVVTAETHRIVAEMLDKGLDHAKIHQAIYDTQSENRLRLVGYALNEKLEVLPECGTAFIALSKEELYRFNHRSGDTEGLVNQALSISGVKLAAFFREGNNEVKISFRSKGAYFVNELASVNFNGGGHKYAAGGFSAESIFLTKERFKSIVLSGFYNSL
jgi:phosphoesterase RecJ-like protein